MAGETSATASVAANLGMRTSTRSSADTRHLIRKILTPVASLRLTVALFAMSIVIVFIGTLAQTEKDIWQVVHDYFRMDLSSPRSALATAFAWIDFRIFFPEPFFPNMTRIPWGYGFWFPSGWLIGLVMFANLTAAHMIRFRMQAKGSRRLTGIVVTALGALLLVVVVAAGSRQTAERLPLFADWPSLRILWLLTQCTAVSVVLLAGCGILFHRRAGIVLLHAGVGLLMLGELLVGVFAVEGQMQITEGRTVNYVLDTRTVELAFVDTSDPDVDDVVVIPESRLQNGVTISDSHLPFDVEVLRSMKNSRLRSVNAGEENLATSGNGLKEVAEELAPIGGTDVQNRSNQPSVYVRLVDKESKSPQASYLVSLHQWMQGRRERIQVGDKRLTMELRYKHMYKPYSMHLIDVKMDRYMGTQTAKGYASELRLVESDRNVDRKVRIWMNNPLRFSGATFYQSNYGRDAATGKEYTGLQVVTNTGWRIPYVACMMVTVGMFAQFWLVLTRFLKRRDENRLWPEEATAAIGSERQADRSASKRKRQHERPDEPDEVSSRWHRMVPIAVVLFCGLWLGSKARLPNAAPDEMDIYAFGQLPVVYEGRIKPFDTLARNSLRIISDKQTFKNRNEKKYSAARWLLDVITNSKAALDHPVIRIQNPELLDSLGLKPRKGFRYAINEFIDSLADFDEQVRRARMIAPKERGLFERKVMELDQRLNLYMMLREAFRVPRLRPEHTQEDLAAESSRRQAQSGSTLPLAIPPGDGSSDWKPYSYAIFDAIAKRLVGQPTDPAATHMAGILNAYSHGQAEEFNTAIAEYHEFLVDARPGKWSQAKTNFESFFNHFSPTFYAMILYLFGFLLVCFSWLGWSGPLNRASTWLILFTLAVHTLALCGRMYISGRPPVTNLYSSAIFVGWGCVILGLILERVYKNGVGNVIAAVSGFAALLIAFLLTTAVTTFKGDSFTVLVAVLDTQFWLATHVTCIALGYSTTFVAGLLGVTYVLRGVLTPSLSPRVSKEIGRMIYGTLCFAIFFSFFGTVLGGLWADDSWGRFWGWDPKENGALIIVLWNALILHASFARIVRERGLAVLAIVGNIVTCWSWFGVNELRVGLHSYGFTEGVLLVLGLIVLAQLMLIGIGLMPKELWWSNRRQTKATREDR